MQRGKNADVGAVSGPGGDPVGIQGECKVQAMRTGVAGTPGGSTGQNQCGKKGHLCNFIRQNTQAGVQMEVVKHYYRYFPIIRVKKQQV